ncbi:WG repeat-containing protein [Xylophilus sp. GOD-11R]|uniref:WG repeat-containing protein n=1 Tax=Xylophilus sp. GOD-11R TaxID=3089814 RepID=UPI00298C5397|nr:WG repeat-containing protein [Xylophilus sp. GOD-11R]WPB59265.1 WG repeat-containing protein [Xylophilus sp. GOD-11R]
MARAQNQQSEFAIEPCQSRKTALWGLCRSDGSDAPPVVAQTFDFVGSGSALFPARAEAGSPMGYIDRRGQWRVPPRFTSARSFSEGLGVVTDGNRSAAIDATGHAVIPWFDGLLYPFSQGRACFVPQGRIELGWLGRWRQRWFGRAGDDPYPAAWWKIEGRAGFMDTSGKVVMAPQFEPKLNFLVGGCGFGPAGFAAMRLDGQEGLIDRDGRWAVRPEYEYLGIVFSGNRKVVAMIADRMIERGWLLDTIERMDGFMGPDGDVRWRDTGGPREMPVAGGLVRSAVNYLLFPRWQQDLTRLEVSTAMLLAWLGSLALGAVAGMAVMRSRRGHQAFWWRLPLALGSAVLTVAVTFLLGLLSVAITAALLLGVAVLMVRAWRKSRRTARVSGA